MTHNKSDLQIILNRINEILAKSGTTLKDSSILFDILYDKKTESEEPEMEKEIVNDNDLSIIYNLLGEIKRNLIIANGRLELIIENVELENK